MTLADHSRWQRSLGTSGRALHLRQCLKWQVSVCGWGGAQGPPSLQEPLLSQERRSPSLCYEFLPLKTLLVLSHPCPGLPWLLGPSAVPSKPRIPWLPASIPRGPGLQELEGAASQSSPICVDRGLMPHAKPGLPVKMGSGWHLPCGLWEE